MESRKQHYKMYKAGKYWAVASLVAFAFGLGGVQTASADNADTGARKTRVIPITDGKSDEKPATVDPDTTTPAADATQTQTQTPAQPADTTQTTAAQVTTPATDDQTNKETPATTQDNVKTAADNDHVAQDKPTGNTTTAAEAKPVQSTPAAADDTTKNDAPAYLPTEQVTDAKSFSTADTTAGKDQSTVTDPYGSGQVQAVSGQHQATSKGFAFRKSNGGYATGLVQVNNHVQYFDRNYLQVKGAFIRVADKTYYADANTGNLLTGIQQIDGRTYYFDKNGQKTVSGLYYDGANDLTYYLENGTPFVGDKWITTNDGKQIFCSTDSDGHLLHQTDNRAFLRGTDEQQSKVGRVYTDLDPKATKQHNEVGYFDMTGDGRLQAKSERSNNLTSNRSPFAAQNAAYDATTASFDNVDGYLTVDAWYRPKQIFEAGSQWRASTAADRRPLLMAWSPNRTTQVNYLNYMASQNLVTTSRSAAKPSFESMKKADLDKYMCQVQANIEQKISRQKNVDWLRQTMTNFITSQPQWSAQGERRLKTQGGEHIQDAALSYVNSELTPDANSNFRLLNRTPANQTGQTAYFQEYAPMGVGELLLANDVDNSNPIVQAEQLNWLHYLTEFGSITGNDPEANFDGIRVDAVDNVDADLLQIAADYFKHKYKTTDSDKNAMAHLSIQENWSANDPLYTNDHGNHQLTMDDKVRTQMIFSLGKPVTPTNRNTVYYADQNGRDTMKRFMEHKMVDRSANSTENEAIPNYSFVRAHDSGVQTIVASILQSQYAKFRPTKENGGMPAQNVWTATKEELKGALEEYKRDMNRVRKNALQHNIPSAHAMMLTNKDTIPRIYYGDLYMEDGQYMAQKSPYFDAIDTLLKARKMYVAGGQSMAVDKNDILTSVRYGKGAMTADATGTAETRTQGIGTIISNNPKLALKSTDTVTLQMGTSHKNQDFRALVLSTANGLKSFASDQGAPIKRTNSAGELIFTANEIRGFEDVQVSGYLSVWVPVGAKADQDARTVPSAEKRTDGNAFRSNAALDSQVIYEGFSTFQDTPTKQSEFTNVVIAKNIDLFQSWGVTSFQLAPQYRASTDTSFLDAIMANGYAFTDRYDLGFGTPTKYGTDADLRQAIKALHRGGMQAIADFVPDQIYNLPGKELVTATYVDSFGRPVANQANPDSLYVSATKGGGDYQKKYGGEYLEQLKRDMPEMFKTKQISTGVAINGDVKIKEWSAKYFNGTNAQGNGVDHVLRDDATKKYFKVATAADKNVFLPGQLTNTAVTAGFSTDSQGRRFYYSAAGVQAKNSVITDDNGDRYYFDQDGFMATGLQKIAGDTYYFMSDGRAVRDTLLTVNDGQTYNFSQSGRAVKDHFWRVASHVGDGFVRYKHIGYFGHDGLLFRDKVFTINGSTYQTNSGGVFIMNRQVTDATGTHYYKHDGVRMRNEFKDNADGSYAYYDNNGNAVTGMTKVEGNTLYFDGDHKQVKDKWVTINNRYHYFDGNKGAMYVNRFKQMANGAWVYLDEQGRAAVGRVTVNGQPCYFGLDYVQVKDAWVNDGQGYHYYRGDNGALATEQFVPNSDGSWSYVDAQGDRVIGVRMIDGQKCNFGLDYKQIKDTWVNDDTGYHYYRGDNGAMAANQFVGNADGSWSYVDGKGDRVIGPRIIDGQKFNFGLDYKQIKGIWATDDTGYHYYRGDNGAMATNQFVQNVNGSWSYVDGNSDRVRGEVTIDGQTYLFADNFEQVKGQVVTNAQGQLVFYDANSGQRVQDGFVTAADGSRYHVTNGQIDRGAKYINGRWYYFDAVTGKIIPNKKFTYNGRNYVTGNNGEIYYA